MERRTFIRSGSMVVGAAAAAATASTVSACTPTSSPRVNVKDFCAVGDGITDDTAAIVNAINSFTGGGVVYFPPGKYKVSSTITLKPNLTLLGESKETTVLLASNNNQVFFSLVFSVRTDANVKISGIQLNANTHTSVVGVAMVHPDNVLLSEMLFVGCLDNVNVDRCVNFAISRCHSQGDFASLKAGRLNFYSTVTAATDPYPYCFAVTIDQYYVFNTGNGVSGPCLSLNRVVGCTVTNLKNNDANIGGATTVVSFTGDCQGSKVATGVVAAGTAAVYFGPDALTGGVPTHCTVSDFDMDQFQTGGVWVSNASAVTISNCNITSSNAANSGKGVLVSAGSGIVVQGCTLTGFTAGHGSLFGSGVTYSSFINNQLRTCGTGVGIVPGGGATGFNVTGNTFGTGVTTPIVQGLTPGSNLVRDNIGVADIM